MSQENVETTHRFTEALVRGDYETAATELGSTVEIQGCTWQGTVTAAG